MTHCYEVPQGSLAWLWLRGRARRRNEVVDNYRPHSGGLGQPFGQRAAGPTGHVHETVDLRNPPPLKPADPAEDGAVRSDLVLVRPLIGLRDPEMNGHDHPLMWPSPGAQRRPRRHRALGVHNAVAGPEQRLTQGPDQEYLMPVPVPDNAGRSAARRDEAAEAEDGQRGGPAPRERRNDRGLGGSFAQIPAQLLEVRVNSSVSFSPQNGRDDQRRGWTWVQFASSSRPPAGVVRHAYRRSRAP